MNKRYVALLALLACLTGCLPVDSLNPLYTDKDVVFDETMLGTWIGPDNGVEGELEISALSENGKDVYVLTMIDKNKDDGRWKQITVYHARLVNLSGRRFLDVVPEAVESRSDTYSLQINSGKDGSTIAPRLLRLSAAAYLEFGNKPQPNGKLQANLRRAHWFFKVNKDDKKLQFDWADDDVFKKAVQSGSMRLSNSLLGKGRDINVVITASTPELQKFMVEHSDDGKFFSEHMAALHRKP